MPCRSSHCCGLIRIAQLKKAQTVITKVRGTRGQRVLYIGLISGSILNLRFISGKLR